MDEELRLKFDLQAVNDDLYWLSGEEEWRIENQVLGIGLSNTTRKLEINLIKQFVLPVIVKFLENRKKELETELEEL